MSKLIVTANVSDLSEPDWLENAKAKVQAMIDNDTIVPSINPTALAVKGRLTLMDAEILKRDNLGDQIKQCTINIQSYRSEITGNFTNSWANQIQVAVNGDEGKVKLLHFGVKHSDDTTPEVTIENSLPSILKVNNSHLEIGLEIINDTTKNNALPFGAKDLIVFLSIGNTEPTDIKTMQYLGVVKKGKISHNFAKEDIGKTAWFIAVYDSKETGKPVAKTSKAVSATII
ncbi:MAG: hypothetical protein WCH34_04750 [Bacteroidota bacterium]